MIRRLILAPIIVALTFGTSCFSGIGPEEIVSFVLSDDSGNTLIGYRVHRTEYSSSCLNSAYPLHK